MHKLQDIIDPPTQHWVGDGFPVRSLFSYHDRGRQVSPFLLLDYAGPARFEPTSRRRGVGEHPHRGFETITIVYAGEVEHRDSTGAGGIIGPGDVQWMTAAAGILHEEFHAPAYARRGGEFELVQLWLNLPARHKMVAPRYQTLLAADIPAVGLPEDAGQLRVIAGEFAGSKGPARSFTPVELWDVRLKAGKRTELAVPEGHTLIAAVLAGGNVRFNGEQSAGPAQLALFGREGGGITIAAEDDAKLLLLAGAPIDEPIVGHGPFVMNTAGEIKQAMLDYAEGRFGELAG
jgi:redox-sensitive bicupin YhaK (pirin superfamily)